MSTPRKGRFSTAVGWGRAPVAESPDVARLPTTTDTSARNRSRSRRPGQPSGGLVCGGGTRERTSRMILGDGGDPVSDGAAAQVQLRQDASDGDLPDHLIVGEYHARLDGVGSVSSQQLLDPLHLALQGEELGRLGRFPTAGRSRRPACRVLVFQRRGPGVLQGVLQSVDDRRRQSPPVQLSAPARWTAGRDDLCEPAQGEAGAPSASASAFGTTSTEEAYSSVLYVPCANAGCQGSWSGAGQLPAPGPWFEEAYVISDRDIVWRQCVRLGRCVLPLVDQEPWRQDKRRERLHAWQIDPAKGRA